jgi:hypothetical protein
MAARVVDDQRQRLVEDVARDGVPRIIAVLLAQEHAVALHQTRAALHGLDLDAFDVELDQIFSAGRDLAVVEQIIERDDGHLFAISLVAGDAEGLVLGA